MSILPINEDFLEFFELETHPERTYLSASHNGITGSVSVFPNSSPAEKETRIVKTTNESYFTENNLEDYLDKIILVQRRNDLEDIRGGIAEYMELVNSQSKPNRLNRTLEISNSTSSIHFNDDFLKKIAFKNLYPHYRENFLNPSYGYTNYHSINFFTASNVPSNSAILYPNSASKSQNTASGSYSLSDKFTFDFYINPRYVSDGENEEFKAGTIFHLSSTYAVSLLTGTLRDENGLPDGFRLALQLSHSADVSPSKIDASSFPSSYPNDLIFLSEDNSLRRNHWHHIGIRWGGKSINDGTGSFFVDTKSKGNFVVPSSSIAPQAYSAPQGNPSVLCVGNFLEGTNSGENKHSLFFGKTPADRDGVIPLILTSSLNEPSEFSLSHPLNAEVHELKIYNEHRSTSQIFSSSLEGPKNLKNLAFYLPPFFTRESPKRTLQGSVGGVLETPFRVSDRRTNTPVNTALLFRVNVRDVNLENFTRDFANLSSNSSEHEFRGREGFPRLYNLTSSQVPLPAKPDHDANSLNANEFMYATGSFIKRNLTLLPNDNGKFVPNFDLLKSGTNRNKPEKGDPAERFVGDLGTLDLSHISLNNLIENSAFPEKSAARDARIDQQNFSIFSMTDETNEIFTELAGPSPNPGEYDRKLSPFMYVHYNIRDESYNKPKIFEISNLFYGQKIEEGTFSIFDNQLSGSNKKIKMTLKDNGLGSLYRADAKTTNAKWASQGNIFYNEGLVGILNPSLSFFGENFFEINFKGTQDVYVRKVNILAQAGMINSSSNPTYDPTISASLDANIGNEKFVLISDVLLHDENLNILARSSLASPIVKKQGDKFLMRISLDF